MQATTKQEPPVTPSQPQPALDEVFALLGQTNQLGLEQLFDRMRPERGDR